MQYQLIDERKQEERILTNMDLVRTKIMAVRWREITNELNNCKEGEKSNRSQIR